MPQRMLTDWQSVTVRWAILSSLHIISQNVLHETLFVQRQQRQQDCFVCVRSQLSRDAYWIGTNFMA